MSTKITTHIGDGFREDELSSIRRREASTIDTPKAEPMKITYERLETKLKGQLDYFIGNGYRDNFVSVNNLSEALRNLVLTRIKKGE